MSKQANPTVIGIFFAGVMALIVAGVMIFGSGKFFRERVKYVLFFEGSVKGLNIGAPVDFKGVRVGSVTDIKVLFNAKDLSFRIPVYIEIDRERITEVYPRIKLEETMQSRGAKLLIDLMVGQGLRAQLELQSLVTGQLGVHLDFFPEKTANFVGAETGYVELPTIQSSLQALSKTIEKLPLDDLANKLVLSIEGIERFINSPDLKDTVSSLNQAVKEAQELLHHIDEQVGPLASGVDKTLGEARNVLRNVDKEIKPLATSIDGALKNVKGLLANIDSHVPTLLTSVENTFKTTEGAVRQADKTLSGLESLTGENSALRYELTNTLKELSSAARSIRVMVDLLERHPEALIQGKGKYEGKGK